MVLKDGLTEYLGSPTQGTLYDEQDEGLELAGFFEEGCDLDAKDEK